MKTQLIFCLILALFAVAGADSREQSQLDQIQKQLARIEKDLGERRLDQRFVESTTKKLDRLEEKLAKLSDNPEVAAARTQLAQLRQQLSTGAAQASSEAAAGEAMLTDPAYDSDREQMLALEETFKAAAKIDANNRGYGHAMALRALHRQLEVLKDLPPASQQLDALSTKWEPVTNLRDGRARFIAVPLKNALKARQKFEQAAADFKAEAPARVAELLTTARASTSTYDQLEAKAIPAMEGAEQMLAILAAVGQSDPALTAQVSQASQAVTQREKELATALIAANRAPANAYTGGDRAAIESAVRSAWKARYPNLQVLEVRMPESWSRETGWRWDSTSKAFRRFDESSMRVSTVLATSPTVATWQTQWVHTFHLSGNKLVVQPFKYDEPSPRHQLLRSNL